MQSSTNPLDAHIARFKEDGFTVFGSVFDEALMSRWRERHTQLQDEFRDDAGEAPFWFGNMCERSPRLMMPAVAHPLLLDFAEAVMGPFVQLDNLTLVGFPSKPPEEAQGKVSGWHRDRWGDLPSGGYQRPLAINAITYFQDLTPEYGPLRVIAGSHRQTIAMTPEERARPHPQEQVLSLKAGDVAVIHNLLAHSGTPNTSGKTRYFFSVYFNLTWLKTTDNHNGPNVQMILREARERNDRRLMRLFGEDEHLQKRVNAGANGGFLEPAEPHWREWAQADKDALRGVESASREAWAVR